MWVKIDQDETQIHMAMRVRSGNGVENHDFTFRAGLEENKNTMHGAPMTGHTRGKGGAVNRFGGELRDQSGPAPERTLDSLRRRADAELRRTASVCE